MTSHPYRKDDLLFVISHPRRRAVVWTLVAEPSHAISVDQLAGIVASLEGETPQRVSTKKMRNLRKSLRRLIEPLEELEVVEVEMDLVKPGHRFNEAFGILAMAIRDWELPRD